MRYRATLPLMVLGLGLGLAGCGGGGFGSGLGDLVDTMTGWLPDTKKPLPGERKAVFPEGVPGVPQGVPPELVKGYQAETAPAPEPPPTQVAKPAAPPKPGKPKADSPQNITPGDVSERAAAEAEKPKPKKKTAAKPPEKPAAKQPAPPAQSTQSSQPQNQANRSAWPGVTPTPQSGPTAPWPAPQSQPTAAWPDPRQPQQPSQ